MEQMDNRTKEDIQRLAKSRKTVDPLDKAQVPDPVLAKTGFGARSNNGGINGPLVETAYADRVFYTSFTMNSTDGLFTIELRRIKTMKFIDALGKSVEMQFKDNV